MTTQKGTTWVEVGNLAFDLKNPRLSEYDLGPNPTEAEIIQLLWDIMDVRELVLSIHASGFFVHEPLIVVHEDDKDVVIEGNRRLAAVKLLSEPELASSLKISLPTVTLEEREKLRRLPVLVDTRENAWQYLGFKHINGPAKWSSYGKSQYIADVHAMYNIPLEDIARQIGDTHRTVLRLFRGLMVIEQAERMKVFNREDRYYKNLYFSHLYTGLGYDGISTFLGLNPETDESQEPVPLEKKDELGELCVWLFGSKREDKRPVIRSQNPDLRNLDTVVAHREAVAALRRGTDLSRALEISRPPTNVFEQSLTTAKRELENARSVASTGYDGSTELLRVAYDAMKLATDLHNEMFSKVNPPLQPGLGGRP